MIEVEQFVDIITEEYSFSTKIEKGLYQYKQLSESYTVRFHLTDSLDDEEMRQLRSVVETTQIKELSIDKISFSDERVAIHLNPDS